MTEKKTTKKAQPVVEVVNEAMDIVAEVVEVSTNTTPQTCEQCGTLVTHCICQWRGNETFDCDCTNCPCMEQVSRDGALCATCKAHE